MRRGRERPPAQRLAAALLVGLAACGGPQKLGDAGSTCFRDDDCSAGLICVAPTADEVRRVCSGDATPLISTVNRPPPAMPMAGSGGVGGEIAAAGAGGTVAGSAQGGQSAGSDSGGNASAGRAGGGGSSAGQAGSGGMSSAGTAAGGAAGGTETGGSGGTAVAGSGGTDLAGSGGTL